MAWKDIPEKKVLATLKSKDSFKGTAAEKMTIYVDGAVPGGDGDVQGISMTVDPSTYVMTTQLKDGKGGNVGSPATVDLPLESMVVSGEYDDATKSVILTLKNGQTVSFSVADLVSGLQTEITSENPLSADLVAETADKNFVTSEEKEDIDSIPGLYTDVDDVRQAVDSKQDTIDENNPLNADYIDDSGSDKKLVNSDVASQLEDIASNNYDLAGIQTEIPDTYYGYAHLFSPDWNQTVNFYFHNDDGDITGPWVDIDASQNGAGVAFSFASHPEPGYIDEQLEHYSTLSEFLTPGVYQLISPWSTAERGVGYDENGNIVYPLNTGEAMGLYIASDCYDDIETTTRIIAHPVNGGVKVWEIDTTWGTVANSYTLASVEDLQAALLTKQDVIDSSHKLSADLIAETNTNKVMTASERTKLSGIASGAEVNVQSNWNESNSSSDAYIQNKPTNVSAFTNDAGYQDASQVSSAIASAVGQITSFEYQVVQALPQSGVKGVIYLVANSGTTPNIYDEYIWVNNTFEKIGTTEIDLSDYVTNSDLHDYTASVAFTSENGIEITDDDDNSIGFTIETDAETGNQNLAVTGPDGSSFNVPNADDVADALAGKADAIDPSLLPQDAEQQGVIVVEDHTEIDAEAIQTGQIVVDTTENKPYIAIILTDPETGDQYIEWHEIETSKEVLYVDMTVTSLQDMTFTVSGYTAYDICMLLDAGVNVIYRLTLTQALPGLAAGIYDFRPIMHVTNASLGGVMSTMVGPSGSYSILGIASHTDSGDSTFEMRQLANASDLTGKQDVIDANNKLSADLIDNSNSTNKTYETGTGAPTTSTTGSVGELYVDSNTGKVYVCTDDTGGTYTWVEVSGSGSGVIELTSADYDYPAGSPTGVAIWNLPDGVYHSASGVSVILSTSEGYSLDTVWTVHNNGTYACYTRNTGNGLSYGVTKVSDGSVTGYSSSILKESNLANNLTTTGTGKALDARQGKVLDEKIPVITMTSTDPGEGASLAANNFIAVYEA